MTEEVKETCQKCGDEDFATEQRVMLKILLGDQGPADAGIKFSSIEPATVKSMLGLAELTGATPLIEWSKWLIWWVVFLGQRAVTRGEWLIEEHQKIAALREKVARLERASRTRANYDLRCDECGAPHWLDTSISSESWNKIAPDGGVLCLLCIDAKLEAAGLKDEAEFYFVGKALVSKLYAESRGEVQSLEREVARLEGELEAIEDLAKSFNQPHIRHLSFTYGSAAVSIRKTRALTKGTDHAE